MGISTGGLCFLTVWWLCSKRKRQYVQCLEALAQKPALKHLCCILFVRTLQTPDIRESDTTWWEECQIILGPCFETTSMLMLESVFLYYECRWTAFYKSRVVYIAFALLSIHILLLFFPYLFSRHFLIYFKDSFIWRRWVFPLWYESQIIFPLFHLSF